MCIRDRFLHCASGSFVIGDRRQEFPRTIGQAGLALGHAQTCVEQRADMHYNLMLCQRSSENSLKLKNTPRHQGL
eukprot:4714546-Alexandrium_andersonii.AAC.1